ncbi:phosphotransferase family protein [Streptomyces sp. NWU339]|nr:phosphotransferase family protein [Streptomyces sp. NWU339]
MMTEPTVPPRGSRPLVAAQVVRVLRHELALLGDTARMDQLLKIADQLLSRAATDDELPVRRATGPAADLTALVAQELGEVHTDDSGHPQEDPTTSFESAQPPSVSEADLLTAFRRHAPHTRPRAVQDVRRLSGGFSKETARARVIDEEGNGTDVVIRKIAPGRRADGLRPEYDVVSFVAGSGIPVPHPLWFDEDGLGSPAFATTALPGRTVGNVWGWTQSPSLRLVRDLARAMGTLHSLDPGGLADAPLPPLSSQDDHLAAIDEREEVLQTIWLTGDAYRPVFARVLDWLRKNAPQDGAARVLIHGDFALHNALVADDRLTGLLDWERSHIGNPSEDLAYLKPSIDQADAWDDFVEEYRKAGGPPVNTRDLAYFTVWQDLWRGVSSYRIRAKFVAEPTQLSDAIAGLLMSPRFLARAARGLPQGTHTTSDRRPAGC